MHFNPADTRQSLAIPGSDPLDYYALPALEALGFGPIRRLPHSLRIVLESVLRHLDGSTVTLDHLRRLAGWQPQGERGPEVPFNVARIVAPDSSGVPLLADLAAMREAAARLGMAPGDIEPVVPVDLVVDHSILLEHAGTKDALRLNLDIEYQRNGERYAFLKWAASAFKTFRIFPPGTGIVHQLNLERLARGVCLRHGVVCFDSLVGTDSHTTMINGIGVLGWGVGGIEAEAAMLGQPIDLVIPDVVGVELTGVPAPGVVATDIVLTVTQILRARKVVGQFVEFFGDGAAALPTPDRCTIANMAPEYGATVAFFPVDEQTLDYLQSVGRSRVELARMRAYFEAQGMFGMPTRGDLDYSSTLRIDLSTVVPSVAGPSRPQDRIALSDLKAAVTALLPGPGSAPAPVTAAAADTVAAADTAAAADAQAPAATMASDARVAGDDSRLRHGDIVLAAITSCTNTANARLMLAAGLLARKAVQRGLRAAPWVRTSFSPGSQTVTAYLQAAGLDGALDALGFQVAGYGCATCMGNSGPLAPPILQQIQDGQLAVASVLSGNRNFEARIHQAVRFNFLMSPPLVVAFSIAGRAGFDPAREPLGTGADGQPVFLRDIWPSADELAAVLPEAADPLHVLRIMDRAEDPRWAALPAPSGDLFTWPSESTYLRRPPFFDDVEAKPAPLQAIRQARALAILGDSVTTDHINPGGEIPVASESGRYLLSRGVAPQDFNSYISRRAQDQVMVRSAFAHSRIRNQMAAGVQGSVTTHQPDGDAMSIFAAASRYTADGVPMIVFAGEEYGNGSSRDWAAKGPRLLGVRAVIARSFERIHRSNLVGMGILPLEFLPGDSAQSLALTGEELFDLDGTTGADGQGIEPGAMVSLVVHRRAGETTSVRLRARIDSALEAAYFRHGGILPYVLRQRLARHRGGCDHA
jgi:aconitate hydratase